VKRERKEVVQSIDEARRAISEMDPGHREFLERLAWCYLRAVAHSEEEELLEEALDAACEARGLDTDHVVALAPMTETLDEIEIGRAR
jgi:hypothetical protein